MVNSYKFSETATEEPPIEFDNPIGFLEFRYQKGCISGVDNLLRSGLYKLSGWAYDFRPFLKNYVYKQYGSWHEVYAPNKTMLREVTYGKIDRIVKI